MNERFRPFCPSPGRIGMNGDKQIRPVEAVSYTHLDVYKRQEVQCPVTLQDFGVQVRVDFHAVAFH